ncbi:hypothetical protein [Actinophytocola sp.]|uniref:hypothetical protein n=1 Tax=Actinophytocola sp. TaxID=1872138 RepID=UPI003D6BB936
MSNLRTANYSEDARKRLGDAVAQARRAAGHKWRTTFIKEAAIGVRSLEAVEAHEPTVGVDVLERIGRALGRHFRDWNADTPRTILEGGPLPALDPVPRDTLDIRWAAKEELATLLESGVDALAFSRKVRHWQRRFEEEGFTEQELHEVIKQAEDEADASP